MERKHFMDAMTHILPMDIVCFCPLTWMDSPEPAAVQPGAHRFLPSQVMFIFMIGESLITIRIGVMVVNPPHRAGVNSASVMKHQASC
jgi:hypothetical protein